MRPPSYMRSVFHRNVVIAAHDCTLRDGGKKYCWLATARLKSVSHLHNVKMLTWLSCRCWWWALRARTVHTVPQHEDCPHCTAAWELSTLYRNMRTVHNVPQHEDCPHCTTTWGRTVSLTLHTGQSLWSQQLVSGSKKNFPLFSNPRVNYRVHKSPPTVPTLRMNPVHAPTLRCIFILFSHLRLGLPRGLLPRRFPIRTLCVFPLSPIHATCPTRLILLNLITRMTFDDRSRSWRCPLCGILLSPPSLLDPNVSLIAPFSNTLSLYSAVSVRDQVPHPYETTYTLRTGQNIVCILYLSHNLYPKIISNLDTYIWILQHKDNAICFGSLFSIRSRRKYGRHKQWKLAVSQRGTADLTWHWARGSRRFEGIRCFHVQGVSITKAEGVPEQSAREDIWTRRWK